MALVDTTGGRVVSLTTSDMETGVIDGTPEELIKFKKMQQTELANMCYQYLMMIKETKTENARLLKLITDNSVEEIITLKQIKRKYELLIEEHEDLKIAYTRNEKKIDSLTMTIKNESWKSEQDLNKLINSVPKLAKNAVRDGKVRESIGAGINKVR